MGDTVRGKRFRFGVGIRWHNKAVIPPLPEGDRVVFSLGDDASEFAMMSPIDSYAEWRLIPITQSHPAGSATLTPTPHLPGPPVGKCLRAFEDVSPMFIDRTR